MSAGTGPPDLVLVGPLHVKGTAKTIAIMAGSHAQPLLERLGAAYSVEWEPDPTECAKANMRRLRQLRGQSEWEGHPGPHPAPCKPPQGAGRDQGQGHLLHQGPPAGVWLCGWASPSPPSPTQPSPALQVWDTAAGAWVVGWMGLNRLHQQLRLRQPYPPDTVEALRAVEAASLGGGSSSSGIAKAVEDLEDYLDWQVKLGCGRAGCDHPDHVIRAGIPLLPAVPAATRTGVRRARRARATTLAQQLAADTSRGRHDNLESHRVDVEAKSMVPTVSREQRGALAGMTAVQQADVLEWVAQERKAARGQPIRRQPSRGLGRTGTQQQQRMATRARAKQQAQGQP